MMPYEHLDAWRVCHDLVLSVYRASERWPGSERYGIVSQARRAAVSAPANIAEGSALKGSAQFRRHLDIALGSLSELSYLLRLARDLALLDTEEWKQLDHLRNRAGQLTWRLKQALGRP